MRLPIFLISILVGAFMPAQATTLSGKIIDQSGAGKAGVLVSFQGVTAITGADGTWSLSGVGSSISNHPNVRQVTTGGHLVLDEGHLRVSLSGYDSKGRPLSAIQSSIFNAKTAVGAIPRMTVAKSVTGVPDTIFYSWNGKIFLRDTSSDFTRTGIIALFDTVQNPAIIYGWLMDARDGHLYRTTTIGDQTWMAQNLNYDTLNNIQSWCYDSLSYYCLKYGRLYNWSLSATYAAGTDQGICPNGWHTSIYLEWNTLFANVGPKSLDKLRSKTNDWQYSSHGSDEFGFAALPSGKYEGTKFSGLGMINQFWTVSSTYGGYDLSHLSSPYYPWSSGVVGFDHYEGGKAGYAIRCVKNASISESIAAPTANITNVIYTEAQTVTLATTANDAKIYYTTDTTGHTPYQLYFAPITLKSSGALLAYAEKNGSYSPLAYIAYKIKPNTVSGSSDSGIITDMRDGKVYKWVKVGSQTWLAQNLDYDTLNGVGSWCYMDSDSMCAKYGRLYSWSTAMALSSIYDTTEYQSSDTILHQGICPNGWRVPALSDWLILFDTIGHDSASNKLEANYDWDEDCRSDCYGLNKYGFSILPAGRRAIDEDVNVYEFMQYGYNTAFWVASENLPSFEKMMYFSQFRYRTYDDLKSTAYSLRCIKE